MSGLNLAGRCRLAAALSAATALGAFTPGALDAQYFGRNKVQYDHLDFEVLRTQHFDIHYNQVTEQRAVRDVARMAERWYERLARLFQYEFRDRKPVIIYADKPDFQQTNAISGLVSEATGGVTESLKNRVILPLAETVAETDHVLGHELVHAFQYDMARTPGGGMLGQVPLWVVEGLAEYLSLGRFSSQTAMWMRDAVLREDLPSVDRLTRDSSLFPYRYGHAFWAYVGGRWGDDTVPALYRAIVRQGVDGGIRQALGVSADTLSAQWARATKELYEPLLADRALEAVGGERVLGGDTEQGELNLAPVISPEGDRVAFLSQRDLFTLDLYVADARSGRILRRLASSAQDPHFDAISFASSAGTWSPDGSRFAFVTVKDGDNAIAVMEVASGRFLRTYAPEAVGAIYALAWSPEGTRIAFSGSSGGVTDLFLLELSDGSVERLTHDSFAELHPAWAPDARSLVFTSDRTGGPQSTELCFFPSAGIGFLDLESGEVQVLTPLGPARHGNPRFTPDGGSVYFVSDRDGFSDIYRLELASGAVYRVSRLASGVTGLSPIAPALSVAARSGRLMFSVFEKQGYVGYGLDPRAAVEYEVDLRRPPSGEGGTLPPVAPAEPVRVDRYLDDPATGLPDSAVFDHRAYRAGLTLDYIAPPSIGVGVDRFGTVVGGSVAGFFSDMLGNHQLVVGVQGGGDVQDIGGIAVYQNLGRRLNWGAGLGRIPYTTVYTRTGIVDGGHALDYVIERTAVNQVQLFADYPLSTTRRVESSAGFTNYDFSREAIRYVLVGGVVVSEERIDLEAPASLNLFQSSFAYVLDNSFFGFTSPVRGSRSRFEIGGNAGSLSFATLLADSRRYFFKRPVTLAFRALHYGRYLGDAEDGRLSSLFLGYPTLVRGYESGSFEGHECSEVPGSPDLCPEWDRLVGSRLGVANVELRVPLVGTEQFGLFAFRFLPVELALFADAGAAWWSDESVELDFTRSSLERIPVFSAGTSLRLNLLGALVAEIYFVHPFQRPEKGWHFGFVLAPGW